MVNCLVVVGIVALNTHNWEVLIVGHCCQRKNNVQTKLLMNIYGKFF